MLLRTIVVIFLLLFLGFVFAWISAGPMSIGENMEQTIINLPQPHKESEISLEETILKRRSEREFKSEEISIQALSQILWSAQGITDPTGKRTAPSAGATYPLEVYVFIGNVESLDTGIYRYLPHEHQIEKMAAVDKRKEIAQAALGQEFISKAPLLLVFSAFPERTTDRYGERGYRYVHMEAGHAAQNVYLQCVAQGLGTVVVGAFHDEKIREILNMAEEELPLYIMPVGNVN